jgi:hypothetical protein
MGELRRLNIEWNRLVEAARDRGIRHIELPELQLARRVAPPRRVRVVQHAHFQIDRVEARARVRILNDTIAPFYAPDLSVVQGLDSFGVEIECYAARGTTWESIAEAIRAAGVMCHVESYNHMTRSHWKIVTDASVAPGRELVSPPLYGEEGIDQVRKVCGVITRLGCTVKLSCGLHVHIGIARHGIGTWKRLILAQIKFNDAIDSFMAPSRRDGSVHANTWCNPVRIVDRRQFDAATTLNQLSDAVGQPSTANPRSHFRYRKVNLMASRQSHTVEFRQHQGTVEILKTEMWIRFILRLIRQVETCTEADVAAAGSTLTDLMNFVAASDTERGYFFERQTWFAANHAA